MHDGTGQPPPFGYPAAGPPRWQPLPLQKRRRSRWLTIGLPLGLLLVLGGCATAVVLLVTTVGGALGPARQAGEAYATALVEQRWDDAHAMLCDEARTAVTARQLAAQYGQPPLTGYSIDGVNVRSSGGQETGDVTIRFVSEGGLDELTLVPLVEDGDRWRPCP